MRCSYSRIVPGHVVVSSPCPSWYQLVQPPRARTVELELGSGVVHVGVPCRLGDFDAREPALFDHSQSVTKVGDLGLDLGEDRSVPERATHAGAPRK